MLKDRVTYGLERLTAIITDEKKRQRVMTEAIYMVFAAIAFVMSVLNAVTQKEMLLIATSSFCVLCLIDLLICLKWPKLQVLSENLFIVEICVLFTYFIATGGTDNFSIIWLLLLPTVGLFFFGRLRGSILSGVILVIMLVCFYAPALQGVVTDYGVTFETRFPIVYISCFLVSYMLEYVRFTTAFELNRMREKFQHLYNHDALTGIYNRYNIPEVFERVCKESTGSVGIAIYDIDNFKTFNDTRGHLFGDKVLKDIAALTLETLPAGASYHRWGGEEFVILYPDGQHADEAVHELHQAIKAYNFTMGEESVRITVSIGLVVVPVEQACAEGFEHEVSIADKNLYEAKDGGRNMVIATTA